MSRRSGLSSQNHGRVDVSGQNGDPPAPTLTAKIVDKISVTRGHPHSGTGDDLVQLFEELSRSSPSGTAAIEINAQVNCKLVYVVTKAALDALDANQPSAKRDVQLSNASTGLSIICLTLRRAPDILFLDVPDGDVPAIPLFIWLLPKMLASMNCQDVPMLQTTLRHVLTTMSSAKPLRSFEWPRCGPICQYFQECIAG